MTRAASLLLAHPRLVVVAILLVSLGFGVAASRVRVDPSLENLIFQDDPDMVYYRQSKRRYGSDEFAVVGFSAPRLFDRPALEAIERISDALAKITRESEDGAAATPLVDWVLSLTTTNHISTRVDDEGASTLVVEPLLEELPGDAAERRRLWETVVNDPLYVGNVIAEPRFDDPDAPMTSLVFARIVTREDDLEYRKIVEDRIREILHRELRREEPVRQVLLAETGRPELAERVLRHLRSSVPESSADFRVHLAEALAREIPTPDLAERTLRAVMEQSAQIDGFHVAGTVLIKSTLGHTAEVEFTRLTPLSWVVIFGILLAVFRNVLAVSIPLLVVMLAGIWAIGFMALCGSHLNVVSSVIVLLIEVIGIATTIHFFAHFYRLQSAIPDPRRRVRATLDAVGWPCFLASLTTAIGFLSLSVSKVLAVREVGYYSAFGVLAAWLIAMTLGTVLVLWLAPRVPVRTGGGGGRLLSASLERLARAADRGRWAIVAVGLVLVATAIVGMYRIRAETDLLGFLDARHPLRQAYRYMEREFGGISPFDVTVRTPPGELLEPSVLRRIDRLQRWLEAQPEVDATFSPVDYVKRVHQELNDGDPSFHRIPETRAEVATALLLLEGSGETEPFLFPGWEGAEEARILARRIESLTSAGFSDLLDRAEAYLATHVASEPSLAVRRTIPPAGRTGIRLVDTALRDVGDTMAKIVPGAAPPAAPEPALESGQITARVTGITLLYVNTERTLVSSQMSSLALAFVVIWVVVMIAFRSPWLGTIAMIPNLFPIFMVLGFMGYAGITINIGTVMIGSICIGIAVDDTLHFLSRYRRRLSELGDVREAVYASVREVGRPIVITSIVLSLGFLTLRLSSFTPHTDFGLLSALTILTALVGDLLLLPACLLILKPHARRATVGDAVVRVKGELLQTGESQ